MKINHTSRLVAAALVMMITGACGQAPSFLNREEESDMRASSQGSGDALPGEAPTTDVNGDGVIDASDILASKDANGGAGGNNSSASSNPNTDALPGDSSGGSGSSSTDNPGGGGTNPTTPTTPTYPSVPGATDDDLAVLHKCMAKWKNLPWTGTVPNFRKIYASVSIGGIGTPISDTERTAQPELVLIYAGVNVGGATQWDLLNPNGYYCMKVNVNVQTDFDINLHCNARLADNSVQVNVGGTSNNTTAGVGVNVLSSVTVNTVRPSGDQCVR